MAKPPPDVQTDDDQCMQQVVFPHAGRPVDLYLDSGSSVGIHDVDQPDILRLRSGEFASFNSFFNNLFLANWREYTPVREIGIRIALAGRAVVQVFAIDVDSRKRILHTFEVSDQSGAQTQWVLDLSEVRDGPNLAAIHFTIRACDDCVLHSAAYVTRQCARKIIRLSVGLCAYNREPQLAQTVSGLRKLKQETPELVAVIVVNQGEEFADPTLCSDLEAVGATCIAQPNLGGCGGFNRSMLEAVASQVDPTHHILLDDDIVMDPRVIRRTIQFLSLVNRDVAIGGQMLIIEEPTILYEAGARADDFLGIVSRGKGRNLSLERSFELFYELYRVDYNAWWYCAIPVSAIGQIGQSMPIFIHGDDIEYGVRLGEHGVPTVALPGVAVWHDSLVHKARPWIHYYDLRNAMINTAVHPSGRWPHDALYVLGAVMQAILAHRYDEALILMRAVRHFLMGPDALFEMDSASRHLELMDFVGQQSKSAVPYTEDVRALTKMKITTPPTSRLWLVVLFFMRFEQLSLPFLRRRETVFFDQTFVHPQSCGGGPYVVPTTPDAHSFQIYRPRRLMLWWRSAQAVGLAISFARHRSRAVRLWQAGFAHYTSTDYWKKITKID
jgi:galactofuranosylgalactofuranosylrhamnosyl-N-acetylglucosaminyl-diphospho-decaprenol beta-1,5/1,6-galactofuranosyltransferase